MPPPPAVGINLPDLDAIRSRIDQVDQEAKFLRQLLRLTLRYHGRQSGTAANVLPERREATLAR